MWSSHREFAGGAGTVMMKRPIPARTVAEDDKTIIKKPAGLFKPNRGGELWAMG
jgi:hypothetical protein